MKNMYDLGSDHLLKILQNAKSILEEGFAAISEPVEKINVIGTILHNAPWQEAKLAEVVAAHLNTSCIHFDLLQEHTFSRDELLREVSDVSSATDFLLTAYIDRKTFGAGRMVTEQLCESRRVPLVSMLDDVYGHQSALAQFLSIVNEIGTLKEKQIAVSWGFGSRFELPNIAHSLVLLSSILGAHVRIVSPKEFPLLNRVIKNAKNLKGNSKSTIEETHEFKGSFEDADAVIALNWCHLEQFSHPERNAEVASSFRHWFFSDDNLPKHCLFSTQPPAQTDLLADTRLLESERNLTRLWWRSRIAVLGASIAWVVQNSSSENPYALI